MNSKGKEVVEIEFWALGTQNHVQIVIGDGGGEKNKAECDLKKIEEIYRKKERIFSRFDVRSELSGLNDNLGEFLEASDDILKVAERILRYHESSSGLFDPRIIDSLENAGYKNSFSKIDFSKVRKIKIKNIRGRLTEDLKVKNRKILFGKRMDFSGIAKGYIVDQAEKFLKHKKWENFLVDSGGDMYAKGFNKEGGKWTISLEGIAEKRLLIEVSDKGIATSGITRKKWKIGNRKFHHLINPNDPCNFSFEIKSVTAMADSSEKADFLAKILFLMGKEKGMEYCEENKIEGIYLDRRGNTFVSPEAKKIIIQNV